MARPRKSAEEKLSEHVHFLITLAGREALASKARAAGQSEGDFLRGLVDGAALPRSRSGSTDPALIAALNGYAVALSKIGNNVNQLAAASHQGRDFTRFYAEIGAELQADLQKARGVLDDILESLPG